MGFLSQIYDFRHRILQVGLPALVSRGTMVVWGLVTIFIIRVLPEEAYAIYAVAKSLEMFGILLGGGFIQQAIMKLVAEGDTEREKQLANAGMVMALCFAVLSAVFLMAGGGLIQSFYGSLDMSGIPLLLAGVVVTGTLSGLPRCLLLSRHRTKDVMLSDILQFLVKSCIIGTLLILGTLRTPHQIFFAVILANIAAFILSSLLARDLFFPGAGMKWSGVSLVMKFAFITLGTSLASFIYSRTDILMLGKIAPGDVAAYGAARSLSGMILVVVAAANMVLLPLISRMWKQGQRGSIMSRVWSTVLLAEVLMAPVILLYVLFPRWLMDFIYSGKYNDGWQIMLVLGALSLVRPLGSFFSTASAAVGKPQYSLYSVIISSIFNIGLNIILIPRLGGFGAALATAAAVIFGTLWVVWATVRYMNANSRTP
ncbi:MAG: polysaccharide biosynthesis C-terminal domain-containing protein [Candidatus Fermentibacteraceae bacterium]|nr:polysaccharide biosynthesis C-terminal domain-containing protein [Candidatus Fermentibacteraceae bacterium]